MQSICAESAKRTGSPVIVEQPTNEVSAMRRIERADTVADLQRLERSLQRLYDAGILTQSEYARLDGKLFDKIARIETQEAI